MTTVLSALISEDALVPIRIETTAEVHLGEDNGPKITEIVLHCTAAVPGLTRERFSELAETTKKRCLSSRLFAGAEVTLVASLEEG
jgi:osmotically inducible protein OsmC